MNICGRRFDPGVPMRRTEAQRLVGDEMDDDDGACGDAFLHININNGRFSKKAIMKINVKLKKI